MKLAPMLAVLALT